MTSLMKYSSLVSSAGDIKCGVHCSPRLKKLGRYLRADLKGESAGGQVERDDEKRLLEDRERKMTKIWRFGSPKSSDWTALMTDCLANFRIVVRNVHWP